MLCDYSSISFDCWLSWSSLAIAGMTAGGLIATLTINKKQLQGQKEQLIVSNYKIILDRIDSDLAKASRHILYNSHILMKTLIEKYPEKNLHIELFSLNEIAKYTSGIYEGIGLLLTQNKELKDLIVQHHGFTIGRLWKIIQPLHQTWKINDHVLDYTEFKALGMLCVEKPKWKDKIKEFHEENYLKNANAPQHNFLVKLAGKVLGYDPKMS